jgi:hypothetical protein
LGDQEVGDYANGFDVTCSGPFEFDLQTNIATLNDNVKIVSADRADDWLSADQIALQLGAAQPIDVSTPKSAPEPEKNRQWSLQSIECRGQPAVLNSGTRQLLVRGERLKYSLESQTVEVAGTRGVELRQANLELMAADALYQIAADGSLGAARMTGPGAIRRGPTEQQPPLEIQWQDQLTIGEDAGQKLISLFGDAKILLTGNRNCRPISCVFWLWSYRSGAICRRRSKSAMSRRSNSLRTDRRIPRRNRHVGRGTPIDFWQAVACISSRPA